MASNSLVLGRQAAGGGRRAAGAVLAFVLLLVFSEVMQLTSMLSTSNRLSGTQPTSPPTIIHHWHNRRHRHTSAWANDAKWLRGIAEPGTESPGVGSLPPPLPPAALLCVAAPRHGCKTSMGNDCDAINVPRFNKYCRQGDFCMDSCSNRYGCPFPQSQFQTPYLGCVFRPNIRLAGVMPHDRIGQADSVPGAGVWNCSSNTWVDANSGVDVNVKSNSILYVTYGDSTAHNIYTGLALLRTNYTLTKWMHDRNTVSLPSVPGLLHVCCGLCACGKSITSAIASVKAFVDAHKESGQAIVVVVSALRHLLGVRVSVVRVRGGVG